MFINTISKLTKTFRTAGAIAATSAAMLTFTACSEAEFTNAAAQQLVKMAAENKDALLKAASTQLASKAQTFVADLKDSPEVKATVQQSLDALTGGNGAEAIKLYSGATTAGLSQGQVEQLGELQALASAVALRQEFPEDSNMAKVVKALKNGDIESIVAPITKVIQNVKLSPQQLAVVTQVVGEYAPELKGLLNTAGKVGGAVNTLKSLF